CKRYGFKTRAANLIDGHGGNTRIASALERGLARGILSKSGLDHVAEDGFVDLLGINSRPAGGFGYDFGAQFGRRKTGEAALKFANGCTNCRENYRGFHRAASNS